MLFHKDGLTYYILELQKIEDSIQIGACNYAHVGGLLSELSHHLYNIATHLKRDKNVLMPYRGFDFIDVTGDKIGSVDREILEKTAALNSHVRFLLQEVQNNDSLALTYLIDELEEYRDFSDHIAFQVSQNMAEIEEHVGYLKNLNHKNHKLEHNVLSWLI